MKKQTGFTLTEILIFMIMLFGGIGWIMNIYFLVQSVGAEVWTSAVLRFIGVIIVPAGAVMGYIPF